MVRLYHSEFLKMGQTLKILPPQSLYLTQVMRLKKADEFLLFQEESGEFRCVLCSVIKNTVEVKVLGQTKPKALLPYLGIAFSILKPDSMRFLVEKSSELGVTDFYPLLMERTQIRSANTEKWKKYAIEACEQCERVDLPKFHSVQTLHHFCQGENKDWIVALEREESLGLLNVLKTQKAKGIIIGPEGGLSPLEKETLKKKSIGISFGERILRAETSAIMGLSLIQATRLGV